MNSKTAESFLFGYRKDGPNDPLIEKAYRSREGDSEVRRRVEEQVEFDRQLSRAIHAMAPPEDLRERVLGAAGKRPPITMAAWLPAAFGLAIIVALLVIFAIDRSGRFPGSEAMIRMVASANRESEVDLEPVSNRAGELGDWFYVRGFDAYQVPPELRSAPAIGSRLFKQDGNSVAQVAVDSHHALIYVFRADAFGVELSPEASWRALPVDDWQAVIRKDGNICTMVALRGSESEMRAFLLSLKKP